MNPIAKSVLTLVASAALIGSPSLASIASADDGAAPPSYSQPGNEDETIHGVVTAFDGHYALSVRDDRGFIDNVRLHDGTIINPTGLTLAPGEHVTILGANGGGALLANEIDTPYQPGYGYGPYYGPYRGYYGPAVDIGFGFGYGHGWGRWR